LLDHFAGDGTSAVALLDVEELVDKLTNRLLVDVIQQAVDDIRLRSKDVG